VLGVALAGDVAAETEDRTIGVAEPIVVAGAAAALAAEGMLGVTESTVVEVGDRAVFVTVGGIGVGGVTAEGLAVCFSTTTATAGPAAACR
jgi:hypothetical protein